VTILDPQTWRARRAVHHARVDSLVGEHRDRRRGGEKHPVEDFLFTYYSHRPAQLRRWHPGFGVVLADASADGDYIETDSGITLDPGLLKKRREAVDWIHRLLRNTASRPAHFGCFGMHEWAMVYRQTEDETRHNYLPLRLGADTTAAVVDEMTVRCSHFDAFRFFTAPARPLNLLQPTRDSQPELEQPGCLHANMDLYKWAYKLSPLIESELVMDCFELARAVRTLDMQASPYNLSGFGLAPVMVETADGRAEYARRQREFAERSAPLRDRLVRCCEELQSAPR